jgi:hypothetical protein
MELYLRSQSYSNSLKRPCTRLSTSYNIPYKYFESTPKTLQYHATFKYYQLNKLVIDILMIDLADTK